MTHQISTPAGFEDFYNTLFDALPGNSILLLNDAPRYTVIAATAQYIKDTGTKKESLIGKAVADVFSANIHDDEGKNFKELLAAYDHVLKNKEKTYLPVRRYDLKDESDNYLERYWKESISPVLNGSGEVIYIIHNAVDITEQVKAERRAQSFESSEKAYSFFMTAPVIIGFLKGDDYIIEMANEGLLEVWGKTIDVIGKPLLEAIPELEEQGFIALLDQVRTTGEAFYAYEYPITLNRHGKKEVLFFDFVYKAFYETDTERKASGVISVGHDVTMQVLAKKKFEESINELQFVMDVMPQIVWVTLPDGYHDYYNKQWYDYTGLSPEESKGIGWNSAFHPEDQERAWKVWRHSLETGEPYEIEYRCRRFDGVYRWFLGRALPLKNESDNILKWFGTCTDIDDQKKGAELLEERVKERTRELQQANFDLKKVNEELEQFTYVSHHDLQEPLRKIMIFTDLVKSESYNHLPEVSQMRLDRVVDAARRMSAALNDVLEYASLSLEEQYKVVDLNEILIAVKTDLEVFIDEKSAIVTSDNLPVIEAVPQQMHQLFYNLLNNALKFSKPDQAPVIEIRCKKLNGSDLKKHSELDQTKKYSEISVKDNGIGFHQDAAEKIFGMFQRLHTKKAFAGTGIGLSLCKKIVSNHKGIISAESKNGEGAVFTFILPL